jgi:hypothetical protein
MDRYDPNKTVGLMFNEWGTWYDQIGVQGFTFCQSTVRDAIAASIHLNTFLNNCERVQMACVAQPVNVIMPLVLTNKLDQRQMVKTPTLYTYKLYKVHQNAKKIPSTLQSAVFSKDTANFRLSYPLLTASASIDSAKTVNITVSNAHLSAAQTLQIQLNGSRTYRQVTGQIITAPIVNAYNDFGKPEQVNIKPLDASAYTLSGKTLTVTLPSKSVVLLTLDTITTGVGASPRPRDVGFSIGCTLAGVVTVGYGASQGKAIQLRLCGIDGRTVARKTIGASGAGGSRTEWQLKRYGICGGVYILHAEANGVTKTKQIVFAR